MSVSASDIVVYGSANMPEDDSSTSGGAIDTATKVIFTDISATDSVECVSDNAGDTTQTITINIRWCVRKRTIRGENKCQKLRIKK